MKNTITLALVIVTFSFANAQGTATFHDYNAVTIQHDTISLSQYYGKKVMVVNTATDCGYTPQYADLQSLYDQYHQYNFEIVGFPCNDFGGQENHSDSAIEQFCTDIYSVTFQMMSRVAIVTGDTAPVYKWLQRADLNGEQNVHVTWNFNKFLIDEAGHWVQHYASPTSPLDPAITDWIMTPSVVAGVAATSALDGVVKMTSPNPTTASLDFSVNTTTPTPLLISLYSLEGKQLATIYNGKASGTQQIQFPLSGIANGMYCVQIESKDARKAMRVVVAGN